MPHEGQTSVGTRDVATALTFIGSPNEGSEAKTVEGIAIFTFTLAENDAGFLSTPYIVTFPTAVGRLSIDSYAVETAGIATTAGDVTSKTS